MTDIVLLLNKGFLITCMNCYEYTERITFEESKKNTRN